MRSKHNHHLSATKLYCVWKTMRQRCNNPKNADYKWYGGQGITICKEWDDPQIFYDWGIANGYREGLTIDRKENTKSYSPDNCRWITLAEQQKNKRNVHLVTYRGETKTLQEWSSCTGISSEILYDRIIVRKWEIGRALFTPNNGVGKYIRT